MPIMIQNNKTKLICEGGKIAKMYCEEDVIYSSGNIVTYMVDSGVTYQEEVDEGESCLNPASFTPAKSGWEFVGWRQDTTANGSVASELLMGDEPVTLYAVFSQTITLSYNGNGGTGSTAAQTALRYYNNGNVTNATFALRSNNFARSGYSFAKWAFGSASGTQYGAGATVTLSENATFYALWKRNAFTLVPTSSGWTTFTSQGQTRSINVYGNPYGGGGIWCEAYANQALAIAGAYTDIDTGGLSKVDITLGAGMNAKYWSISVGSSTWSVSNSNYTSGQTKTLSLSGAASQRLQFSFHLQDTSNQYTLAIKSLYFHD